MLRNGFEKVEGVPLYLLHDGGIRSTVKPSIHRYLAWGLGCGNSQHYMHPPFNVVPCWLPGFLFMASKP